MPLLLDSQTMTMAESGGISLQFDTVSLNPLICATATATITNIQESMDGLDLTCFTPVAGEFTSTVLFDVIDICKFKLKCHCVFVCLCPFTRQVFF